MGRNKKSKGKKNSKKENTKKTRVDFCCGVPYVNFTPATLQCRGHVRCIIPPNAAFYAYEEFCVCVKCFSVNGMDDTISVFQDEGLTVSTLLKKDLFEKKTNIAKVEEPIVSCGKCNKKFHQICVLHLKELWEGGFICEACLKNEGFVRLNKHTVSNLRKSELSDHIEKKVTNFLARHQNLEHGPIGKVQVRMLSSTKKTLQYQDNIKKQYKISHDLPYQSKLIFVFQQIDGCDVAIFAFSVQEYGADCKLPNRGRVYLSYVDSVKYFQPSQLRTDLYFEVLLGYLEYAKITGFTHVHIWVCPPGGITLGNDYLFNCHPQKQKMPGFVKLGKWYVRLLDRGKKLGIIIKFQTLFSYLAENKVISAKDIPYFEGDHWPMAIENVKSNSVIKKKKKCKPHKKDYNKLLDLVEKSDEMMKLLYPEVYNMDSRFLVVTLSDEVVVESSSSEQEDLPCKIMSDRDYYMKLETDNNLEFSMLRRAKFSTLSLLQKINHANLKTKTCKKCSTSVKKESERRLCTVCFLCNQCCQCKIPVPQVPSMASRKGQPKLICQTGKTAELKKSTDFLKLMWHAKFCEKDLCTQSCQMAKRAVEHVKTCIKLRGCQLCCKFKKHLMVHARYCVLEGGCDLPDCDQLRGELDKANLVPWYMFSQY